MLRALLLLFQPSQWDQSKLSILAQVEQRFRPIHAHFYVRTQIESVCKYDEIYDVMQWIERKAI